MRTRGVAAAAGVIATVLLSGCGGALPPASELPEGSYTGQTAAESDGSYGVIDFTVSSGAVTDAYFRIYDADGTVHDENYGLGADGTAHDAAFYQRAQNAIAAEQEYMTMFEETGDQAQVEAIAGASLSFRLFRSAVNAAIENAS